MSDPLSNPSPGIPRPSERSAQDFKAAFEQMAIGVAYLDLEGKYLWVNEKFCEITGYESRELLAKDFREITHPADLDRDLVLQKDFIAGKMKSFTVEKRYICKGGGHIWANVNISMICEPSGLARYSIAVVEDITRRKQAEEALRLSQSNMATAQAIAHFGSWEIDFTRQEIEGEGALYWSDEVFRIFGHEPRKIKVNYASFYAAVHPEDRDYIREAFNKALETGGLYAVDHRILLPCGEVRHVHEEARPFYDDAGKPLKMVGIVQDVTERDHAVERIEEQAELLNKTQDAITVRDLNGTILFWNKGAERITGWSSTEAVGQNAKDLTFVDRGKYEEALNTTREKGEWMGELHARTKDDRTVVLESRWSLLRGNDGQPKSIMAIHTDITEKKKIEAHFLRAQRMESIGTLAGGIAHDLNNVLAPILMSIEVLKAVMPGPDTADILETIETSARRGADMVKQVLSFARGMDGQRVEVQPRHLVKEIERIITETFPKNIRVEVSMSSDGWTVTGDPTQLHQVLLNLCLNARDAMPEGGNLAIRIENRVIDESYATMDPQARAGSYVAVSISDTGVGIPEKIQDKIFEPFFTTKEVGKGTGLGLSTVLAIVRSHGGFINLYSEPGKGTTFKVLLPALEKSAKIAHPVSEPVIPRGNGELLLVVDDEPTILNITRRTLEAHGYRTITAVDGAEAIAIYAQRQSEIALVITDMMMPVMDGAATIQSMTRINPAVKIIAASGLQTNGKITMAANVGVKHFLLKPFTAATLLTAVRSLLDEH